MSDSNPPAEPNRNRKRKSDSSTPSSSSRPPQTVPISSDSSDQSATSIFVDNVIETLSKPLEGRDLNVDAIAEKVLTFTEEYGEKVAASIGRRWYKVRRDMKFRIILEMRYEKMKIKKQKMYLRLFNWLEYYEESEEKKEVLQLDRELANRWDQLDSRSQLDLLDEPGIIEEIVREQEDTPEVEQRKKAVKRIFEKLKTPLEKRNLNKDKIAEKVKEFPEEYGLKVAHLIGLNWGLVLEEMNSRSPVLFKKMEEEKQIMYLRLFNWFEYYEDSDVKGEVLELHLDLDLKKRWLQTEYEREWEKRLTVHRVWQKLREPLGVRTIDVEDVFTEVNRFTERYKIPTKRIAPLIGKSIATVQHQMTHFSGKTYEEMTPGVQELYLRLLNWFELYKKVWQRVAVLRMRVLLWRKWSAEERKLRKKRNKWILETTLNPKPYVIRYDLGLD